MKKFIIVLMAFAIVFMGISCSKGSDTASATQTAAKEAAPASDSTTPSTGTVDTEYDPNRSVDFVRQTSENKRVVTIGKIDKRRFAQPVFVTSFGQSTDAAMIDTVMKRIGVNYVYNATAEASALSGYKTVVIAVGASTTVSYTH